MMIEAKDLGLRLIESAPKPSKPKPQQPLAQPCIEPFACLQHRAPTLLDSLYTKF